jgi:hypothetical protein
MRLRGGEPVHISRCYGSVLSYDRALGTGGHLVSSYSQRNRDGSRDDFVMSRRSSAARN